MNSRCPYSLHYYQIKLIKNISGLEQGRQSLQKKFCKIKGKIK